jgi:hypothetical protein
MISKMKAKPAIPPKTPPTTSGVLGPTPDSELELPPLLPDFGPGDSIKSGAVPVGVEVEVAPPASAPVADVEEGLEV